MHYTNSLSLLLMALGVLFFTIGSSGIAAYERFQLNDDDFTLYLGFFAVGSCMFLYDLMFLYRRCDSEFKSNHGN